MQEWTAKLDEIASQQTKTNVLITTTEKSITKAAKAIEASQEELAKVHTYGHLEHTLPALAR